MWMDENLCNPVPNSYPMSCLDEACTQKEEQELLPSEG